MSIELTTGMLATMFDFPWEDRRKLTYWSDIATASPSTFEVMGRTQEDRQAALLECLDVFTDSGTSGGGKRPRDIADGSRERELPATWTP
ncbi:MAG: hypothetical protein R3E53_16405 [Myxococcota bacterium]